MKGHLPTLDGWRGVAILMVMGYHLLDGAFGRGSVPHWFAHQGARGVDIFFGLSGLLITLRLLEERDAAGSIGLGRFYARRGLRILPPYLLYLAVIVGLAGFGVIRATRRELLGCLFFYRNYIPPPDLKNWYTAHFWTLSVEEHFYLILPLVIVRSSVRSATVVTAAAATGVAIWRKVDSQYSPFGPDALGRTDLRIDGLIWGAFAALLIHSPGLGARISRRLTPAWTWIIPLCLVAMARIEPPFGIAIRGFLIPWMLFATVNNPDATPGKVLESGPLRWVGRLSYSLYIWQQLGISEAWGAINPPSHPRFSRPLAMILAVGSTFLLGAASHYLVERPCMNWGKRLMRRAGGKSSDEIATPAWASREPSRP